MGTKWHLIANQFVLGSGEGEILTGVKRVVMGTNETILLKSPEKSQFKSQIIDSTL
tara:strand:+ start:328 stop:495 length:168 start_codon:yes stop_codon:yes gene_type:complete